jgi:hypothetical protein
MAHRWYCRAAIIRFDVPWAMIILVLLIIHKHRTFCLICTDRIHNFWFNFVIKSMKWRKKNRKGKQWKRKNEIDRKNWKRQQEMEIKKNHTHKKTTHTRAHAHTHTHARTHARMHTRTHARTHTHILVRTLQWGHITFCSQLRTLLSEWFSFKITALRSHIYFLHYSYNF